MEIMQQCIPIVRQPFRQRSKIVQYPEGWENGLSPEEFLLEAKKMLKRKFNDKN